MADITVGDVARSVEEVGSRFVSQVAAFGWDKEINTHASYHWMAPSLTPSDVKAELKLAADRIRDHRQKFTKETLVWLAMLKQRADTLQFSNGQNGPDASYFAALEIANSVARHLPWPVVFPDPPKPEVDWEDIREEKHLVPRDLMRRLRFIASQLDSIEPRAEEIDRQISEIEAAHAAAEQLPTDMAELSSRRDEMKRLNDEASRVAASIESAHDRATTTRDEIDKAASASAARIATIDAEADAALKKAEQALNGATSVGLARAFAERRQSLASASYWWTAGLALSLAVGGLIGWERFTSLREVLVDGKSASVIWANVLLTIVGIGGPVWFAWLSTKQIGTTFRLSEDYAFKASVSQAYEGYRSEAVQIDDALRSRLFEAALDRIEEAPIRLVDTSLHSSPLQELLSNPAIKKQLEGIPNISGEIMALIKSKAGAATAIITPVAGAAAAAQALADDRGDNKA